MGINTKHFIHGVQAVRRYGVQSCRNEHRCKLLIVGGGAGGCSMAWRCSKKLGDAKIIVIEPSQVHYYQPQFTLVAAGLAKLADSRRTEKAVLPPSVQWLPDRAVEFDPGNNAVYVSKGDKVQYDFMIVAVGLVNNYDKIPGLKRALDDPASGVSTIYAPEYCEKTWCSIQGFRGGHAVFTYAQNSKKCSGAAQKIMYLADDYWRKRKLRDLTNITYQTGSCSMFGVPKYSEALARVANRKRIAVNFGHELQQLNHIGAAVFADDEGRTLTSPYNLLHVTPPMSPPGCLARCELATPQGYLCVDAQSLQHSRFPNVFGVGDCLCTPNSKTAAAVAVQGSIVEQNLLAVMSGKPPPAEYSGYGACPLLTSYSAGILAEFLYGKQLCETFPFDQSKERRIFYFMKTKVLPYIYWNKLLKGNWDGPAKIRRIINPFAK